MDIKYGIVYKAIWNKQRLSITVKCNDGILRYYKSENKYEEKLVNHRVSVKVGDDGTTITSLRVANDYNQILSGTIIRQFTFHKGLIECDATGETFRYDLRDADIGTDEIQLNCRVEFKPQKPTPDFGNHFTGSAIIHKVLKSEENEDSDADVPDILCTKFGFSTVPINEAVDWLNSNGIFPEKWRDFINMHLYFERFSERIHVDTKNDSIDIIDFSHCNAKYNEACEILKRQGYESPTLLQKRVFSDVGFWENKRLLIMGSTSSGKTAVPLTKYLMERNSSKENLKMLIAVPQRALANQQEQSLKKKLESFGLDIAVSTSELIKNDMRIKKGNVDIALVIYEKIYIFVAEEPNFLSRYDYVVFDELNIYQSEERGAKAEILNLKLLESGNNVILLGTSHNDMGQYIDRYGFYPIRTYSRPTRIYEYFFCEENTDKGVVYSCFDNNGNPVNIGRRHNAKKTLFSLCYNEINMQHKTIVFSFSILNTKRSSEDFYSQLKELCNRREDDSFLFKLNNSAPDIQAVEQFRKKFLCHYGISQEEINCIYDENKHFEALMNGVAFHNASLPESIRIALETEFLGTPEVIEGGIRIMFATDTLAYGLNSNVDTVIMNGMTKYHKNISDRITYDDYQNCIGRAGRLGYRPYGTAYTFLTSETSAKVSSHLRVSDSMKKTIQYYSANTTNRDKTIGQLYRLIKSKDINNIAFYILALCPPKACFTKQDIVDILRHTPYYTDKNNDLFNLVEAVMEFLLKERMIYENDISTTCDDDEYVISAKGKNFQRVVISCNSYKKLGDALDRLFNPNGTYILDFYDVLCNFEEIDKYSLNFVERFTPYLNENDSKKNCHNVVSDVKKTIILIDYLIPIAVEKHYVSKEFVEKLHCSSGYQQGKKVMDITGLENDIDIHELLSETDLTELNHFRRVFITAMWVLGYSLNIINAITYIENGSSINRLDNIRRKIGEKNSHVVDAVCVKARTSGYSDEQCLLLKHLSVAAFYGINFEWLIKYNIASEYEFDARDATNFHIASIYAHKYKLLNETDLFEKYEHKSKDKLFDEFKAEYEDLNNDTKMLLSKESVNI